MKATLLKGWGYWDVTSLPYGGNFRRSTQDTEVEIIEGGAVQYPKREKRIKFDDGRQAVVETHALRFEKAANPLIDAEN